MKLVVLLLVVVSIARETVSLTCGCKDCGIPITFCVLAQDLPGDYCYTLSQRNASNPNQTIIKRGCYNSSLSTNLCGIRTQSIAVECCKTHYCNNLLNPILLPVDNTTTKPPLIPTLQPPKPTDGSPTEAPTVPNINVICHEYNSQKPPKERPFCHTYTGSCYRLQRFNPLDGSVVSERQGCSESCINERRNRLHRHCCNTSLCNTIDNPLPRPTQSITVPSQISSSSYVSSSHYSSSLFLTSTSLLIQTTTLAGYTNYNEVIDGDTNFIILVVLSGAYLMVTLFVFILIAIICYKQRQLNTLKDSIRAANKRGVTKRQTSQKSLDTLTTTSSSGDSV